MEIIDYNSNVNSEYTELAKSLPSPMIFLAGPTVRANQTHLESWRPEAVSMFLRRDFHGTLIVPEFSSRPESEEFNEGLPIWEYNFLEMSKCIMFWIPRTPELIGLTTNFELGYWLGRNPGKIAYGRPYGAYKTEYTDLMWNKVLPKRDICENIASTVVSAINIAGKESA